jgi:ADP-ribosylation factor 6
LIFKFWDVGGAEYLRPYWRHYYTGTQGVMFVIDATSSPARIQLALIELSNLVQDSQLAECAILVVFTRINEPNVPSVDALITSLDLANVIGRHPWVAIGFDDKKPIDEASKPILEFLSTSTKEL